MTENNYQAHNNLGTAYEPTDLDKALFHYKAALKIKPEFAMALYNLGNIYSKKSQIDEAVNHYLKALQIKPDCDARMNFANVLFLQSKPDDAILQYRNTSNRY